MKKSYPNKIKMPCFGDLLAQIQAKVKFLQTSDFHFLGVKIM